MIVLGLLTTKNVLAMLSHFCQNVSTCWEGDKDDVTILLKFQQPFLKAYMHYIYLSNFHSQVHYWRKQLWSCDYLHHQNKITLWSEKTHWLNSGGGLTCFDQIWIFQPIKQLDISTIRRNKYIFLPNLYRIFFFLVAS